MLTWWIHRGENLNMRIACNMAKSTLAVQAVERLRKRDAGSESLTAVTSGIRGRAYPYSGINTYKPNVPTPETYRPIHQNSTPIDIKTSLSACICLPN